MQFLLVHPGGPFWKNKDSGVWTITKGAFTDEDPLHAAKRAFTEETGFSCEGTFTPLASIKQKNGKIVYAWSVQIAFEEYKPHWRNIQLQAHRSSMYHKKQLCQIVRNVE